VGGHSEAPRSPYSDVLIRIREVTKRDGLLGFRAEFEASSEIPKKCLYDPVFSGKFDALFNRNRVGSLIAALDAILTMPKLTPRLKEIQVPALALVGEYDLHFLELAACYERSMPRCHTVVIPQCAHDPINDQPDLFANLLMEFLLNERPPPT
jgi:pimeloyl-ACP methyl ester carboxylesterase